MTEINEISKSNVQESQFKNICIGREQKTEDGTLLETYFLVVASEDLLNVRKKCRKEFL